MRKIHSVSDSGITVNVYRNVEWDEFVVKVKGCKADEGYHTSDKQDAFDTALAMLTHELKKIGAFA